MDTYKAITILTGRRYKELRRIGEYMSLKSTQARPQVKEIFVLLLKKKNAMPVSKQQLLKYSNLSKKRLDDVMNKLLDIILNFYTLEAIMQQTNDLDKAYYLQEFFIDNKLLDHYDAVNKTLIDKLAKSTPISPREHLSYYQYYKATAIHEKVLQGRKINISLPEYVPHLDEFYLLEKLKLSCESINRNKLLNSEDNADIDWLLNGARKLFTKPSNLMEIYMIVASLLTQKIVITASTYDSLFKRVNKLPITAMSYEEVLTLHHYLINFALDGLKVDSQLFIPKFMELISVMESKDLVLENKQISSPIFKVSISVGLKGNYFKWVDDFMAKYSGHVAGNNKSRVVAFCEALILYYKKKYKEAARKLNTIQLSTMDVHFNIDVRKLELKICIEETLKKGSEFTTCSGMARNMKDFINSKDCLGLESKMSTIKFIHYASKIQSVYSIPEKRMALLNKINCEKGLAERDWLISILNKRV